MSTTLRSQPYNRDPNLLYLKYQKLKKIVKQSTSTPKPRSKDIAIHQTDRKTYTNDLDAFLRKRYSVQPRNLEQTRYYRIKDHYQYISDQYRELLKGNRLFRAQSAGIYYDNQKRNLIQSCQLLYDQQFPVDPELIFSRVPGSKILKNIQPLKYPLKRQKTHKMPKGSAPLSHSSKSRPATTPVLQKEPAVKHSPPIQQPIQIQDYLSASKEEQPSEKREPAIQEPTAPATTVDEPQCTNRQEDSGVDSIQKNTDLRLSKGSDTYDYYEHSDGTGFSTTAIAKDSQGVVPEKEFVRESVQATKDPADPELEQIKQDIVYNNANASPMSLLHQLHIFSQESLQNYEAVDQHLNKVMKRYELMNHIEQQLKHQPHSDGTASDNILAKANDSYVHKFDTTHDTQSNLLGKYATVKQKILLQRSESSSLRKSIGDSDQTLTEIERKLQENEQNYKKISDRLQDQYSHLVGSKMR